MKDMEAESPQIERLVACMVLQWQECLLTSNLSPVTVELVIFPMVHFGAEVCSKTSFSSVLSGMWNQKVRSGQQTKLWLEKAVILPEV